MHSHAALLHHNGHGLNLSKLSLISSFLWANALIFLLRCFCVSTERGRVKAQPPQPQRKCSVSSPESPQDLLGMYHRSAVCFCPLSLQAAVWLFLRKWRSRAAYRSGKWLCNGRWRHTCVQWSGGVTKSLNRASDMFMLACDQSVGHSEGLLNKRSCHITSVTLQIWVTAECPFVLCRCW